MNTNMKELNYNELEQVNGGSVTVATLAAIGLGVSAVSLVCDCIKLGRKIYKDITE